jgi:hypothetical protein
MQKKHQPPPCLDASRRREGPARPAPGRAGQTGTARGTSPVAVRSGGVRSIRSIDRRWRWGEGDDVDRLLRQFGWGGENSGVQCAMYSDVVVSTLSVLDAG